MELLAPWGISETTVGDLWCPVLHFEHNARLVLLINRWHCGRMLLSAARHPHNSNPRPASAAALLRHEDAATSAAGAFDADSNGSDATAE